MGSFDFVKEDPRIILTYVTQGKTYGDLCKDADGYETASSFLRSIVRQNAEEEFFANEYPVTVLYDDYYHGHRRTVQLMKLIRKLAVSEILYTEFSVDSGGIIFGIVRIMVEYLNAHDLEDILHLLQNPTVHEQVDLMIAAWEKAEQDGIMPMAYSYMFVPFVLDSLMDVDFAVHIAKYKNEFRKEALSMSKSSGLSVSECFYLIMNKEYKQFVSECDGTYDT